MARAPPQSGSSTSAATTIGVLQSSPPVGVPVSNVVPHSTTASASCCSEGAVVSATVMVCEPVVWLPQESVATNPRAYVPVPPHDGMKTELESTVTLPQVSPAVAGRFGSNTAPHSTVLESGTVREGAVVSTVVMVC